MSVSQLTLLTTVPLMMNLADLKMYKPCELAQEIYTLKDPKVERILDILMCVAAFHNFNSSSIRTTPDGIAHHGIFGLTSVTWYWRERRGGRMVNWGNVKSDALKFIDESLQAGPSFDDVALKYYRRLCTEPENEVYEIRCHLSDYLMGDYPLILPKHDLLYDRFQFPNEARNVTAPFFAVNTASLENTTVTGTEIDQPSLTNEITNTSVKDLKAGKFDY